MERVLRGRTVLFDEADLPLLNNGKGWTITRGGYCVVRWYEKHLQKAQSIHRILVPLGDTKKYCVDHINRNRLDNRRSNLRVITKSQSAINREALRDKASGITFKGVVFIKSRQVFGVRIRGSGLPRLQWSPFPSAESAARMYDKLARVLHGEFAVLNFPDEVKQ